MENKQFFDPYNFNNMITSPYQNTNNTTQNQDMFLSQMVSPSPTMLYEQQFWYYNYLTKMLEYKIKLKEYEKLNNSKQN